MLRSLCRRMRPHFALCRDFSTHDSSELFIQGRADQRYPWCVHPDLKPYIRACLANVTPEGTFKNADMSLCFLGTGAGQPSVFRSNAATALRMGSTTYLFDAGEGVQLQLMLSRLNMGDIKKIFITHLHGDHVFGLPGLLLSLQGIARKFPSEERTTVQIYGPMGLYNLIAATLSLSYSELKYLVVEVHEMVGSQSRLHHPGSRRKYVEFKHRGLVRKSVPQNPDGTWTLCEAKEIATPEEASNFYSMPGGVYVRAAEVKHIPKLQCFGFCVEEAKTLPRNIDVGKARQLGVKPGQKYRLLKSGFPVMSDDGSREVTPAEVCSNNVVRPRKIAIIGDCCTVPYPMVELCRDADVLVHEATLSEFSSGSRVEYGGHSSPATAGKVAELVRAKTLFLNHISPNIFADHTVAPLVEEAEAVMSSPTPVQMCYDHLEVIIPRSGFQIDKHTSGADSHLTESNLSKGSSLMNSSS